MNEKEVRGGAKFKIQYTKIEGKSKCTQVKGGGKYLTHSPRDDCAEALGAHLSDIFTIRKKFKRIMS